MDCRLLTGDQLDLNDYRFGAPQQAGRLTVLPILGQQASTDLLPFAQAGRAEQNSAGPILLANTSEQGCLLAPLHFGLPTGPHNGCFLAGAALTPPAEKRDLAGQALLPYRATRRNSFDATGSFCLPLALRSPAWQVRRQSGAQRLAASRDDLEGHLLRHGLGRFPALLQTQHSELQSFARQIELLSGQTGALFFIEDHPVGLEIAPSPAYFAAIWKPLLLGCYGLTALLRQYDLPKPSPVPEPYPVATLSELRTEMFRARHQYQERLEASVAVRAKGFFAVEPGQRWRNYRLHSLTGTAFAGQYIEEVIADEPETGGMPKMLRNLFRKGVSHTEETTRHRIVYVSMFAL